VLALLLAAVTGCSMADQPPAEPAEAERALQIVIETRSVVERAADELERRAADRKRVGSSASPSYGSHAGAGDDRRNAGTLRRIWDEIGRVADLIRAGKLSNARLGLERLYWRLARGPGIGSNPTYARVLLAVQQQITEARNLLAGRQ